MSARNQRLLTAFCACVLLQPVAHAVSVGQVDTFEDGTTLGWVAGGGINQQTPPNPPANVNTGGPNGAGDHYLLVTGEGGLGGPGSRLTSFNFTQWAGDYGTAGVTGINLDVNNFSASTLELRLIFANTTFTAFAATMAKAIVAPTSGWINVSFAIDPGSVSGLFGADAAAVMADVGAARLYHSPALAAPAATPTFAGTVGFDNISAVPLPPAALMFIPALTGLWLRRRRP